MIQIRLEKRIELLRRKKESARKNGDAVMYQHNRRAMLCSMKMLHKLNRGEKKWNNM